MAEDGKIASAGGFGESRIFCAPEEERLPNAVDKLLECHIEGRLIRDLHLDPQVLAALNYFATDEGVAERNSRPNVREPSGVELGADPFDKALQQKRDDVRERGQTTWQARDPLQEVANAHAQPGMRARFLSAKKLQDGAHPDYAIVKHENGDPVKLRGMILAHIPEDVARARNQHYQKRGNELLKQLDSDYRREGGRTALSDQ